ncbi:hypothetical protein A2Z33_02665 [Candidatus Gottesmanbacteria bacterium RBG_16_52_11]|uniref:PABS domain-containing protein n=1 Tax=Candidatus Gottesmanbacteria bacterium RBG_16_52_11 TaxID=1798374 RepID=A0A1F5YMP4_9BACT|nr:MAG: hypothetical protein A2Z33_02665 [Candidatus Gottesmanbacteria bacterium RBG_16_52_11]
MLVLGLGGGDVIRLIRTLCPGVRVDAVEIDRVIVSIARKYFGILTGSDLGIYTEDAESFVTRIRPGRYDLIIADLYSGDTMPDFETGTEFLRKLASALSPAGQLVINYSSLEVSPGDEKSLLDKLRKLFQSVLKREIYTHKFFYAPHTELKF